MFCPKCAAPVEEEQKFCVICGVDLQGISQLLTAQTEPEVVNEATGSKPIKSQKAKVQFQGAITLTFALMVGCLIPISTWTLPGWPGLSKLTLVLGVVAGVILFTGIIMLIYADTLPKTELTVESPQLLPLRGSIPTTQKPPTDQTDTVLSDAEPTTDLPNVPTGEDSR